VKKTLKLVAAPTGMQPGGYVAKAYADRSQPSTPEARLEVDRVGAIWRVRLRWHCPLAITDSSTDTNRFVDAAALLVPTIPDAPWITMGAPGKAVEGVLWRADREDLIRTRAEGLGTMVRREAPEGWGAEASWEGGRWSLVFGLRAWPALDRSGQLAFAIWRGAAGDRAGLKSVSSGWIDAA
jgi:DMSO reductase family type II enzyme heme b subunit